MVLCSVHACSCPWLGLRRFPLRGTKVTADSCAKSEKGNQDFLELGSDKVLLTQRGGRLVSTEKRRAVEGRGSSLLLWTTVADTILLPLAVLQVLSPTPSSLKDRRKQW